MRVSSLVSMAGACLALATALRADVEVYKNDSLPLTGGGTVACQAGFVTNEIGAAVFTVPAEDGTILLLEGQFWACDGSGIGFSQPRPTELVVYAGGGPDPGKPAYTSPQVVAQPGFLNLVPLEGADLRFDPGETFTLGVKLLNGGLFANLTTLATDVDGCQAGKSLVFAIPGGWTDACALGVSGDLFVRARVLTGGPVAYGAPTPGAGGLAPSIDSSGAWMLGSTTFAIEADDVLPGAQGFLGYSTQPASLPVLGGTMLVHPAAIAAAFLPVAADAQGRALAPVPIPGDNPALAGVHVYFQMGFLDAGAPGGVSMTGGLDVRLSSDV